MARIRADYVYGTLNSAIGAADTTIASAGLERLPAVSGGDVAALTIYDRDAATFEIVHVTAHTTASNTATILRAQEGTTALAWASGSTWEHGPTEDDFAASGGGSLAIHDEGVEVASGVTQIDFQGAGVTASAGIGEVVVTISGGGGGSSLMEPNAQTADYTLALTDAGKVVEMTSASPLNLTVPPSSSVAFAAGTIVNIYQGGAGAVTPVAGSGVTIRNLAPLSGQYAEASLRYRGSDEWVLTGDTTATAAPVLKDYAEVIYTSGSINLTATTMTAVNTALDLQIAAAAGDVVEFGVSGVLDVTTAVADHYVNFDVYTMPSGAAANPFGAGLAGSTLGVQAWHFGNDNNLLDRLGGSITRTLVAGDVSGGLTTLRFYYKKGTTTARVLHALTNLPLKVWAKNYGPVA